MHGISFNFIILLSSWIEHLLDFVLLHLAASNRTKLGYNRVYGRLLSQLCSIFPIISIKSSSYSINLKNRVHIKSTWRRFRNYHH